MLEITVPGREDWDERTEMFISTPECTLQLEHSLVSLSKWESKWKKAFLNERVEKSDEEILDYIRCMTIYPKRVDPNIYYNILPEDFKRINDYINDAMTATTFRKEQARRSGEIVTSELIYYWMIAFQIPFECQKWHLNRLLTLVRVCSVKNQPSKKMSQTDIYKQNAALNAARRAGRH